MKKSELQDKTVAELRGLARAAGLSGYSGLRKAELIEMLAGGSRSARRAGSAAVKTAPKQSAASKETARARSAGKKATAPKKAAAKPSREKTAAPKKSPARADVERVKGRGLSPRTRRAFSVYRATGEQRVHASKYYLGARGTAEIDEDFVFPETYGENFIALMVRDPYWLFTYWEFSPDLEPELLGRVGEDALRTSRLVLRVYDVTGGDIEHAAAHYDIDVAPSARDWYVNVMHVGCDYCVDIGLVLLDGSFVVIARSNRVSLPPVGPSTEVDEKWVTLETLDEIYHLTDRGPTTGSGGWGSGGWGRES